MTEDIKKLIESVKVYQHPTPLCFNSRAMALVEKSDFDRVVEELEYLSELRKPSEGIKQAIEEFANSQYNKDATLICANSLRESIESYEDGKRDGIIIGAEFALNLSENSGQVDEDLVKKITDILLKNHHGAGFTIHDFEVTAFKIAALIASSPSGENGDKIPEMIVTKKF
jgi:hypothetical protein